MGLVDEQLCDFYHLLGLFQRSGSLVEKMVVLLSLRFNILRI